MTPGESDLAPFCGYMSYRSLAGQFAAATNAAVVLIERKTAFDCLWCQFHPVEPY